MMDDYGNEIKAQWLAIDGTNEELRTYRFAFSIGVPYSQAIIS